MLTIQTMLKITIVSLLFIPGHLFLMNDEETQQAIRNSLCKSSLDWARLTPALCVTLPIANKQNVNKTKKDIKH